MLGLLLSSSACRLQDGDVVGEETDQVPVTDADTDSDTDADADTDTDTDTDTGLQRVGTYTVLRSVEWDETVSEWCALVYDARLIWTGENGGACTGCDYSFEAEFTLREAEDDGSCASLAWAPPREDFSALLAFDESGEEAWSYASEAREWELWGAFHPTGLLSGYTTRGLVNDPRSRRIRNEDSGVVVYWYDYGTYTGYGRLDFAEP